jgi:hypothetical protein
MDVRGSLPLSYVQEEDYGKWIKFLQSHEQEIWPFRVSKHKPVPPLTMQPPNARPVPEPCVMLPSVFIEMLASGRMTPEEVTALHDFDESSDDSDDSSDEDEDDDEEEEDDNEDDDVDIEDFDPDHCSFGRMSVGGYTFDFSESSHESGADNLGNPTDINKDVEATNTIIDNLDKVKSLVTNTSSGHKTINEMDFSKDISQHALLRNGDVLKSQPTDQSSEVKTASNDTLHTVSETDAHTVEPCNMNTKNVFDIVLSQSVDHMLANKPKRFNQVPRTISAPVRVTTALMKHHIQSSSQRHRPIIPHFDKNDGIIAPQRAVTRPDLQPVSKTNNSNDITMKKNIYY